ncbi:hypothetical protein P9Y62_04270 [Bacillus thuringiensis]|uniref:YqaI family protein n=1 Tax=Bacillus thuringiensis TaxID=1428 RepID=UPI0001A1B252|nr:hypothetical protein [Bacillus thuringiensis]EEM38984.1 hypothetical protein bthur0004_50810 [Bacillus thuringiensis serovar sotto str. T04001]MEB4891172.1 hypothetical protein [Bacillus thuringiensis]MEC2564719.1 hypothetical protein [Bacillus thuringiensis]MEC2643607.1 hypothetical protein [Bacillus thuringiensis]MEC2723218.1 hypothetical protein [Bacillus thuringiensis]
MKEVTLIFKSGAKVSFTSEQFKTFNNSFGALSKIEWEGITGKVPFHIGLSNIDAIFVEDIPEEEKGCNKEPDHPIEDFYGNEIMKDETYFVFDCDVVLEQNLKQYLTEEYEVECYQAQ